MDGVLYHIYIYNFVVVYNILCTAKHVYLVFTYYYYIIMNMPHRRPQGLQDVAFPPLL